MNKQPFFTCFHVFTFTLCVSFSSFLFFFLFFIFYSLRCYSKIRTSFNNSCQNIQRARDYRNRSLKNEHLFCTFQKKKKEKSTTKNQRIFWLQETRDKMWRANENKFFYVSVSLRDRLVKTNFTWPNRIVRKRTRMERNGTPRRSPLFSVHFRNDRTSVDHQQHWGSAIAFNNFALNGIGTEIPSSDPSSLFLSKDYSRCCDLNRRVCIEWNYFIHLYGDSII